MDAALIASSAAARIEKPINILRLVDFSPAKRPSSRGVILPPALRHLECSVACSSFWALTVRRSPVDCILLGLAGLLLIGVGLRSQFDPHFLGLLEFPWNLTLGVLGLALLVRAFVSRLGGGHRVGFGLAGCAVTLPFLFLVAVMALFSFSGPAPNPNAPPPAQTNQR